MPVPYRRLGRVLKAHGTDGEVSVAVATDLTVLMSDAEPVWIVPPPASGAVARTITGIRPVTRGVLVRLSGIDTAADAHEIAGRWILGRGEESAAEEGSDVLVGMAVRDRTRGDLGVVSEVIVTGANDVLVVRDGPFGEVLIPVISEVIINIDEATRVVEVALLDGLIDEG